MTMYEHRQTGWVVIFGVGGSALLVYLMVGQFAGAGVLLLLVLLSILALFHSMTVRVEGEEVRISLGIGLIRKRIPLASIRSCRVVRNPWYYGWGIHLFPGGILYNVSGMRAVELTLANQRGFRIGTDEPEELEAALAGRLGAEPDSRYTPGDNQNFEGETL